MEKLAAAALEPSTITDPRTGKPIRIAVPARIKYRKYFRGQKTDFTEREVLHTLSNRELNDEIAKDFAAAANDVVHMFYSKDSDLTSTPKKIVWMEIRKQARGERAAFNFFISKINDSSIDILTVTQNYKKPTKPRIVRAEEILTNKIVTAIENIFLEKVAKPKLNSIEGIIEKVRASGKRLAKSKIEVNKIIRMIKKIEKDCLDNGKSLSYIKNSIKKNLPDWVEGSSS
jgi:hypothetical protein